MALLRLFFCGSGVGRVRIVRHAVLFPSPMLYRAVFFCSDGVWWRNASSVHSMPLRDVVNEVGAEGGRGVGGGGNASLGGRIFR